MVRIIVGVVVGYVVMAALVFTTFTAAYLTMGTEGAFQSGSYEVTPLWLTTSFILAGLAAVVGGMICAVISRSWKGPFALGCVALILGLTMIYHAYETNQAERMTRTGDVGNFEAMKHVRQPVWVAVLNPFIGAAGLFVGSRLVPRPKNV